MKSIIISFAILFISIFAFFIYIIFTNIDTSQKNNVMSEQDIANAQVIEITAHGGYSPASINATANKPTILRIKTLNTFDCSSSLTIPSLNIRKILPANGTTDVNLGTFESGKILNGTCSMGMYSFEIKFI